MVRNFGHARLGLHCGRAVGRVRVLSSVGYSHFAKGAIELVTLHNSREKIFNFCIDAKQSLWQRCMHACMYVMYSYGLWILTAEKHCIRTQKPTERMCINDMTHARCMSLREIRHFAAKNLENGQHSWHVISLRILYAKLLD